MRPRIDVYFDYYSPYAYFLSEVLDEMALTYGLDTRWRPIDVVTLLDLKTQDCYSPAKRGYVRNDVARSAQFYGLPIKAPAPWPMDSLLALRLSFALVDDPCYPAFRRAVFRAAWREQKNIADPEALTHCWQQCGQDGNVLPALMRSVTTDPIEPATRAAQTAGIFGVPTMVLDGELFFGRDRLAQLEWRLAGACRRSSVLA